MTSGRKHGINDGKVFWADGLKYEHNKTTLSKEQLKNLHLDENTNLGRGRSQVVKIDETIPAVNKSIALKKFQEKYPDLHINIGGIHEESRTIDPRTGEHIRLHTGEPDNFVYDHTIRTPEAGHDLLNDTLISKGDRKKAFEERRKAINKYAEEHPNTIPQFNEVEKETWGGKSWGVPVNTINDVLNDKEYHWKKALKK